MSRQTLRHIGLLFFCGLFCAPVHAQETRSMLFGRVLAVWVNDEEPGLDRTMAALDRGLASAERWDGFLGDLCAIPCALRGARRRRRRPLDEGPAEASAA